MSKKVYKYTMIELINGKTNNGTEIKISPDVVKAVKNVKTLSDNAGKASFKIAFNLNKIMNAHSELGYDTGIKAIKAIFAGNTGLSDPTLYAYANCGRFIQETVDDKGKPELISLVHNVSGWTMGQLIELNSKLSGKDQATAENVLDAIENDCITPEMSTRKIREYINEFCDVKKMEARAAKQLTKKEEAEPEKEAETVQDSENVQEVEKSDYSANAFTAIVKNFMENGLDIAEMYNIISEML